MIGVLRVLAEVDLDPLDLAVELRAGGVIVVADRCTTVAADVGLVVQGEEIWRGPVEAPLAGLLAVDVEGDRAAFAKAASIVGELHPHLVLACRDLLLPFDLGILQAEQVVAVGRTAFLRVDAPTPEDPSLCKDDALRAVLRDDDLCGDRVRLVLDVEDDVLRQADHAGVEHLRVAADQLRTTCDLGIEPLQLSVVERQHVVPDRLDQPKALQLAQLLGLLLRQIVGLSRVGWGVQLHTSSSSGGNFPVRIHGVLCFVQAVQPW